MRKWPGGIAVVALASVLSAACGAGVDGPPDIEVDRTACQHCRMLISEPRYAAAYQLPGTAAQIFDDIGCLLDGAAKEATPPVRYWFQDLDGGGWIPGTSAVFVRGSKIRTPMSGGVVAVSGRAAAAAATAREGGQIVASLDALLDSRAGGS